MLLHLRNVERRLQTARLIGTHGTAMMSRGGQSEIPTQKPAAVPTPELILKCPPKIRRFISKASRRNGYMRQYRCPKGREARNGNSSPSQSVRRGTNSHDESRRSHSGSNP